MRNEKFLAFRVKFDTYIRALKPRYIVPEHWMWCMLGEGKYLDIVRYCDGRPEDIRRQLTQFLRKLDKRIGRVENESGMQETRELQQFVGMMVQYAEMDNRQIDIDHMMLALLDLGEDSLAAYALVSNGVTKEKIREYVKTHVDESGSFGKYAVNLNKLAREGKFSKLVGREEEMTRVIQILHKKRACNPVLLGNSGSGKTAIVEGLAQKIVNGDVPDSLKDSVIWSVNLGAMLSGTKYRGDFEERLTEVVSEIVKDKHSIVFIDEIHMLCGAGSTMDSSMDAANILKPYLAHNTFRCIGATTYDEYKKSIEKDKALARRFKKIDVVEPNPEQTLKIIEGLRPEYEEFHHVKYGKGALNAIVSLTDRYFTEQYFPDKAIEVLDELGTRHHAGLTSSSTVTVKDVEKLVARMANVPSVSVQNNDKTLLKTLADDLKAEIYNQDENIDKIVRHVKIAKAGFGKNGKPLGVYGLVGNTGTGKTELVKQLADKLNLKLLRFDMSEYSEQHSTAKLIGSPPGYVGFEQSGVLTEAVIRNPSSVVLFDEIEKADKSIYNLLLQVMDEGRLTDNTGRTAMFADTLVFMTSNVGSKEAQYTKKGIGFGSTETPDVFEQSVQDAFPPEFRNRFTEILKFNDLDRKTLRRIVDKEMGRVNSSLSSYHVKVELTDDARELIAEKAEDEHMGGRPVERLVNSMVAEKLVDAILFENLSNSVVLFDKKENELTYNVRRNTNEKTGCKGVSGDGGQGTGQLRAVAAQ